MPIVRSLSKNNSRRSSFRSQIKCITNDIQSSHLQRKIVVIGLNLLVLILTGNKTRHPRIFLLKGVEGIAMTSSSNSNNKNVARSRLVYGKDDALFGAIEDMHRHHADGSSAVHDKPFGHMLDAGTGLHSIRWIATLVDGGDDNDGKGHDTTVASSSTTTTKPPIVTKFTAITADTTMQRNVQDEVDALGISDKGQVVVGNWFPSNGGEASMSTTSSVGTTVGTATTNTHGSTSSLDLWLDADGYDTILADYLIGAMDGFSPYQQDQMIPLLSKYLKPGGRLYIVGLEPLPDKVNNVSSASTTTTTNDKEEASSSDAANIICRVRQIRDACILLAGHRCYREYPLEWMERQIRLDPTLELLEPSQRFPILYRYTTIQKQINVARSKLKFFPSQQLASEMSKTLDELDSQAKAACSNMPGNKIRLGFDYVVVAEKKKKKTTTKEKMVADTDIKTELS